jgi:hypothetical protein
MYKHEQLADLEHATDETFDGTPRGGYVNEDQIHNFAPASDRFLCICTSLDAARRRLRMVWMATFAATFIITLFATSMVIGNVSNEEQGVVVTPWNEVRNMCIAALILNCCCAVIVLAYLRRHRVIYLNQGPRGYMTWLYERYLK